MPLHIQKKLRHRSDYVIKTEKTPVQAKVDACQLMYDNLVAYLDSVQESVSEKEKKKDYSVDRVFDVELIPSGPPAKKSKKSDENTSSSSSSSKIKDKAYEVQLAGSSAFSLFNKNLRGQISREMGDKKFIKGIENPVHGLHAWANQSGPKPGRSDNDPRIKKVEPPKFDDLGKTDASPGVVIWEAMCSFDRFDEVGVGNSKKVAQWNAAI